MSGVIAHVSSLRSASAHRAAGFFFDLVGSRRAAAGLRGARR